MTLKQARALRADSTARDLPAVSLRHAPDDGEPEARAPRPGGEEGFEALLLPLGWERAGEGGLHPPPEGVYFASLERGFVVEPATRRATASRSST